MRLQHNEGVRRKSFVRTILKHNTVFLLFAGSTSSSASDHWLVRLAGGSKRGSVVSGGPIPGPPGPVQAPESPELPVFGDEPPKTVETSRYLWEH